MDSEFVEGIIDSLVNARVNEATTRTKYNKAVTVLRDIRSQFVPSSDPYRKITEVLGSY